MLKYTNRKRSCSLPNRQPRYRNHHRRSQSRGCTFLSFRWTVTETQDVKGPKRVMTAAGIVVARTTKEDPVAADGAEADETRPTEVDETTLPILSTV